MAICRVQKTSTLSEAVSMSKIHPAIVNHIQAMQDDLADMLENPDDYDAQEPLDLALMLLGLYEEVMEQAGLFRFERVLH